MRADFDLIIPVGSYEGTLSEVRIMLFCTAKQ